MNFIKRGLLSITRKKLKSLILLAVIFVLGSLIAGAVSIQQATGNVEKNIKERLGAAATIELDYEQLDSLSEEDWETVVIEDIDLDLIKTVGELSYVKYYDYTMTTWLGSKSLKSYQGDDFEGEVHFEGPMLNFILKGINYAPVLDFEEKKGKLIDGRVFTQEEVDKGASVAIISKKLAELNNVHVGDTITLINEVYYYDETTGEEKLVTSRDLVLEVIGLFESQTIKENEDGDSSSGMIDWMDMDYQNTIYVPNAIVRSENEFQTEEYMKVDEEFAKYIEEEGGAFEYYTPIFVLKNPEDSEAFEEEVLPLLPEFYTVVSASDQYDSIAGPLESMAKLSKYVLIAAVFGTVLITGLVVLLFLRDRKRELGIYLSLGEKRSKVVGQILIEVLVVAVIGITLSLFSGNFIASQVSDTMIQADNSAGYDEVIYYSELHTNLTTEDVIDSFEVNLSTSYILGFYGIGLLTILISTIIPLIYIVRLNPKKILM